MEKTIGNYQLLRLLGQGGMGAVYEARHTTIERRVAIKLLHKEFSADPDAVKRFQNEARAVNIIGHHNLVSISEFGQTPDGVLYIVMEYLEGETLRDRLRKCGGTMTVDQVLPIARQIAAALAAAHAKQIIHRDLKPLNIMLVPDPEHPAEERVKVLDFGLAKLTSENDLQSSTKTGVIMGTPTYMSPEQCRSGRNAIDRSDIYTFGIILYELLCGKPPFRGGNAMLLADHLLTAPPPLAGLVTGVPPELLALIDRMLAKSPADRPPVSEVLRVLNTPMSSAGTAPHATIPMRPSGPTEVTIMAPPTAAIPVPKPASPSAPGKLIGVAALVVLLLGLAGAAAALRLLLHHSPAESTEEVRDLSVTRDLAPESAPPVDAGSNSVAPPESLVAPQPSKKSTAAHKVGKRKAKHVKR